MGLVYNVFTGTFDITGTSSSGAPYYLAPVALVADLPIGTDPDGSLRVVLATNRTYVYRTSTNKWYDSGITPVSIAGSSSPNGYTITPVLVGNVYQLQMALTPADDTNGGVVTTSAQTIAGIKTFSNVINSDGGLDTSSIGGTLAIGGTRASIINIGKAGSTLNFIGSTIFEQTTQLQVQDPLFTVNKGGGVGSGGNSGMEIEENNVITAYIQTSGDRNSWLLKAPNTAGIATITAGAGGITLNQSSHDPVTIGAIAGSSNANGITISGQVLTLTPADGTNGGIVTNGVQSFAGVKTFLSTISGSISGNAATVTTNANTTGDVTSVGNVTTYNGVVPVLKGGTGSSTIGPARDNLAALTAFNGIEGAANISWTYNAGTRQLTTTVGAGVYAWVNGVRYTPIAETTAAHANAAGVWFFYYVGTTLTVSSSPWDLLTTAPLVAVYYDPIVPQAMVLDERHPGGTGTTVDAGMANATHRNLHLTRGTQLTSDTLPSGYTLNASGTAVRYATSAGTLLDEDLQVAAQATLLNDAKLVTYRIGVDSLGAWTWTGDADGFLDNGTDIYQNNLQARTFTVTIASPAVFTLANHGFVVSQTVVFTTTGALPTGLTANTTYYVTAVPTASTFRVSATRGGADIITSGTQSGTHTATAWGLVAITSNSFVNYYLFVTTVYNSTSPSVRVLMGQTTYASLALAQAANVSEITSISTFSTEGVFAYRMTYQRGGAFGASGNARLAGVQKVTTSLLGTGAAGSVIASIVSTDTSGFSRILGVADTTVQAALNTIDLNASKRSSGDIDETSFSSVTDVVSTTNITGFAFANATVRSFRALVSVLVSATSSLYTVFDIIGVQRGADWIISTSSTGDVSTVTFNITTAGQVQFSKTTNAGFTSTLIKFRALTSSV